MDGQSVCSVCAQSQKGVGNLLKDMYIYYPSIKVIKADKGYLGARLNETEYKIECVKFTIAKTMAYFASILFMLRYF